MYCIGGGRARQGTVFSRGGTARFDSLLELPGSGSGAVDQESCWRLFRIIFRQAGRGKGASVFEVGRRRRRMGELGRGVSPPRDAGPGKNGGARRLRLGSSALAAEVTHCSTRGAPSEPSPGM